MEAGGANRNDPTNPIPPLEGAGVMGGNSPATPGENPAPGPAVDPAGTTPAVAPTNDVPLAAEPAPAVAIAPMPVAAVPSAAEPTPEPLRVPSLPPAVQWALVALVLACHAFLRYGMLDFPLERDEGEYAYAGQLILQGIPPYELAYNMKLPGTYAAYAAIMAVFGESTRGIHLGLLVMNSLSIVLVFLIGRRLFDPLVALSAAASFAMMSTSFKFLALAAHATHFVVVAMLAAVWCLLIAGGAKRRWLYFCSGVLFGLAFLMKQQGVFFGVFGGVWIIWEELRERPIQWERMGERVGLFSVGCIAPFVWVCIALWQSGVFGMFWFWTVDYAREYAAGVPLPAGIKLFVEQMRWAAHSFWPLMALMAAGAVLLWYRRPLRGRDTFLALFFGFSFLTACPGLYFRHHYFIPVMPAAALLVGVAVSLLWARLVRPGVPRWCAALPVLLLVASLLHAVWRERRVLFADNVNEACRIVYGNNPFRESIEIARYIRAHSTPKDRVAVLGSEPQIYFYSQRHSATGFIYTYSLVEEHRYALQMQAQMAKEIEASEPKFFIYVNVPTSWIIHARAPREIFEWLHSYCRKSYTLVGVVDFLSPEKVDVRWDDQAKDYVPQSKHNILIFRRNPPQ